MKKKIYITSALPYVNAIPHVGFSLEMIQADVLARYYRQLDYDVFFLTGTDENSLKNVQGAEKAKMDVQQFVDRNAQRFYDLKKALNLSFDDFIRTTEGRHIDGATRLWQAAQKDIYKKKYKGLYCVDCEEFYKEEELVDGLCPEHKTKPEIIEEENYFFALSKYAKQIREIILSDKIKIIPASRKNEILKFIDSGLRDFCISRSAQRGKGWGIKVPSDETQIMWTWFDALSNYINALGYADNLPNFEKWWQKNDNVLHIIGKGILRFHAIYWPAMLLAANLNLPRQIFVHGYVTIDGDKISKSRGNTVDPFVLVKKYGADALRYFLLREISPTEDGDFSLTRFEERYNGDLANGLGNLVSRVLALSEKASLEKRLKTLTSDALITQIKKTKEEYAQALVQIKFQKALEAIWQLIQASDEYIGQTKPWQLAKTDENNFNLVMSDLILILKEVAYLLVPFMPQTSEKIIAQINENKKGESLFPRTN